MTEWLRRFPGSVTVSDAQGIVLWMNDAAARAYARYGGRDLVGTNMLDCHPEPSRTKVADMLAEPGVNVYTIEQEGRKRLVYQTTWYDGEAPRGLVEVILELPEEMPHFVRE